VRRVSSGMAHMIAPIGPAVKPLDIGVCRCGNTMAGFRDGARPARPFCISNVRVVNKPDDLGSEVQRTHPMRPAISDASPLAPVHFTVAAQLKGVTAPVVGDPPRRFRCVDHQCDPMPVKVG
jgi:hypothetical protein